jgi:hypothetical protein
MPELNSSFVHIENALSDEDILFLKNAYKAHLAKEGIPCYALLDLLETPTFRKIKRITEEHTRETVHYLNDFYFYTDPRFTTGWHVDTELYAFESAINAWILMSPENVEDPLAFMADMNTTNDNYYHSVHVEDGECVFAQYCDGTLEERSFEEVEANRIHTPNIRVGDILLLNPRRFHRTNTEKPKHACAIKFILGEAEHWLSSKQVPEIMWPEVGVFNRLVGSAKSWEKVILGIREELKSSKGREALISGFYPENFGLLKEMSKTL